MKTRKDVRSIHDDRQSWWKCGGTIRSYQPADLPCAPLRRSTARNRETAQGHFGAKPVWDGQGGQVFSTPDAIGKVLERYLDNRDEMLAARQPAQARSGETSTHTTATSAHPVTNITCPECGSNVEHVTGCVVCYNCGWSKC